MSNFSLNAKSTVPGAAVAHSGIVFRAWVPRVTQTLQRKTATKKLLTLSAKLSISCRFWKSPFVMRGLVDGSALNSCLLTDEKGKTVVQFKPTPSSHLEAVI